MPGVVDSGQQGGHGNIDALTHSRRLWLSLPCSIHMRLRTWLAKALSACGVMLGPIRSGLPRPALRRRGPQLKRRHARIVIVDHRPTCQIAFELVS
jgi:hypothetical protein